MDLVNDNKEIRVIELFVYPIIKYLDEGLSVR